MSEPTPLHRLARFAARQRDSGLDADLGETVRRHVVDVIGNCLAARSSEPARIVEQLALSWGGEGRAGIVGGPAERLPAPAAALVNGTLAHALDFDDTHLPSVLHPSASVVPAALAVAEDVNAGGLELLTAVAVGNEICVRLGMAGYDDELGNSVFFERGLHATAICGTFGAATAAAVLRGLDADGIGHAIAIAASMGAGLLEANRTGGSVKRIHCGWAAHGGVVAADLAMGGLTGPPTVLEGRFGFLQAYCGDRFDLSQLVDNLGERWEVARLFIKPYPCNHFTHAGIDAARELRRRGVRPGDLKEVEVGVATPTLRTIAEPSDQKGRPSDGYAARFSGPFTFALALRGGSGLGLYLDDFTDATVEDPELLELAARLRFVSDPTCDDIFPHQFPAIVRARTTDGKNHEIRVLVNRGGPEDPLSDDEVAQKFRLNAGQALPTDLVTRLDETLQRLPALQEVSALTTATPG
jgi:2-methylcitrate dehydratase PrpD